MLSDQLERAWRDRLRSNPIEAEARFAAEGLLLGAGTLLASRIDESAGRDPRLSVLMMVAHLRTPSTAALAHLRKAARRWGEGEEALARMHLALSGLARLRHPEADARRLFFAEALLESGMAADDLLRAMPSEARADSLAKYSPDQPRVPAGSGRASGQWTASGVGGSCSQSALPKPRGRAASRTGSRPSPRPAALAKPRAGAVGATPRRRTNSANQVSAGPKARTAPSVTASAGTAAASPDVWGSGDALLDLGRLSIGALARVAGFVGALAPASAAGAVAAGVGGFGLALIPMDIPTGRWVRVAGPGNVSIFQSPTVPRVTFRYTTADGVQEEIRVGPGPGGEFRDPRTGQVFARLVRTGATLKLLISVATLLRSRDPQLCPVPKKESHGPLGQAYEDQMKPWFNRGNPTPSGFGYAFRKLRTDKPVVFDDCQKKTGVLAEYKGPEYERHLLLNDPPWWGMEAQMILQAGDQVEASKLSGNRAIYWFFAEKSVADYMRSIFRVLYPQIRVIYYPMRERRQ